MSYEMESREHVEAMGADMLRAEIARLRAERDEARKALAQAAKAIEHFAEWTGTSDYDADIQAAREALEGK